MCADPTCRNTQEHGDHGHVHWSTSGSDVGSQRHEDDGGDS